MHIRNWKKYLVSGALDVIGGLLFASGVCMFAKDADFAPGGLSGLALIINHLWHTPVGITTLALNIPLAFISFHMAGHRFVIKSFCSMVVCTLFMDAVFPLLPVYNGSRMLSALFSGVLIGAGMGAFYMHGSSSGGTDFLTVSIKVLRPHLSVGTVTMTIDAVIILLGWPVFGSVDAVLYGLISTAACSFVIDRVLCGVGSGKMIVIVTDKGRTIAQEISKATGRGSTLCSATGTYTGSQRQILLCACSNVEAYKIRSCAYETDSGCFVMISDVNRVYGEGFSDPGSASSIFM